MFFISFDKLIEILSPLILIVCIIAIIGLNKDYDAEREQEKRQALEDYQIASDYIDPAEILKRYFSQNDLHFVNQDDFTFYKHDKDKNIDIYERKNTDYSRDERVTVNSETQEIKSYWISYINLTPDSDITKKTVNDYSDFIKGKFDETARWSKIYDEKKYNASGILTCISSKTDGKVEMYHSDIEKNGIDYCCLISPSQDSVSISITYDF